MSSATKSATVVFSDPEIVSKTGGATRNATVYTIYTVALGLLVLPPKA